MEAIANDHPELPRLILEYRGLAKLRSTYTEKLPEMINRETGRVHTSYHQAVAATGGLSSSGARTCRTSRSAPRTGAGYGTAFIAPEGRRIVACDYSQIELRIMAHLSGDAGLIDRLRGRRVTSTAPPHRRGVRRAARGGEWRTSGAPAKAINFGLIYGMGAHGLARQLGIARTEAQDYIAPISTATPAYGTFMEQHPGAGAGAPGMSRRSSAGACISTTSMPGTRTSAPGRSAPPSMRPCRAPPRTSSSAPCSSVDGWLAAPPRACRDDHAGAR
jgi:DNA polymerase I